MINITNQDIIKSTEHQTRHLYLIDGSGFIFRAFHALPPLTRKDGVVVNAVYGYIKMITKLIRESGASHIAVIFDRDRKSFRSALYPDYKAHRPPAPDDLIPQFDLIRQATQALGLFMIDKEGYEADDIIATYVQLAQKKKIKATIVSSDKDLMQLIDGVYISMLDPLKNKEIGLPEVTEKFGVPPEKLLDVLSLTGDASDNVPGVPGIGIKTAALLINEFGTLENLLASAHLIPQPKRRQSLQDFAEQARLSKQLITLESNVDVALDLQKFQLTLPDTKILENFLLEQNFDSLWKQIQTILKEIFGEKIIPLDESHYQSEKNYTLITDYKTFSQWITKIREQGYVAFDTETTSLQAKKAKWVGFSFALSPGEACYVPLDHQPPLVDLMTQSDQKFVQLSLAQIKDDLRSILENPAILKIGHNIKYDQLILLQHDIHLTCVDDTMLMSYVQNAGLHMHSLDALTARYYDHKMIAFKDIVGTGKSEVTFDYVPLDKACAYAAEDADYTLRLYHLFKPNLRITQTTHIYETIERALISPIVTIENNGIKIDHGKLLHLDKDFTEKLHQIERDIFAIAGTNFNIASPKQLGDILFEKLDYPGGKKGKSGAYVTNVKILEKLAAEHHPLAEHILDWRQLTKLKNTYIDSLIRLSDPQTKRVHTSFVMTGALTGRLSSTEPNIQNIPIRTEEGRQIRKAFIAEEGHQLVSLDYSQIELRLLAEIANIGALKEAFKNNIDIHALTASEVFNIPIENMDPLIRRKAKAINFGIIYGMSAFGLGQQLGISTSEAKNYINFYFERFPGIQQYMEDTKEFARSNGYVKTLFNRIIHLQDIHAKMPTLRAFAERQAINAPLQGTAADIIKRAMIKVDHFLTAQQCKTKMLLQVHDELLFEVPFEELEAIPTQLISIMENAHRPFRDISVPLKVDKGQGQNWSDAH